MLHDGDAYLIVLLDHGGAEGLRDDVECLGGIAIEDYVTCVFLANADEARDELARILDGLGRFDGKLVETPQRIGVHGLVEVVHSLDDACGTLRGGRAIEERQVWHGREKREILLVRIGYDVDRNHR